MLNFQGLKIDRQAYKKALSSDQALISGIRDQDRQKDDGEDFYIWSLAFILIITSQNMQVVTNLLHQSHESFVTSEFTLWTM